MSNRIQVAIVWRAAPRTGSLAIGPGRFAQTAITQGQGRSSTSDFAFESDGPGRLEISIDDAVMDLGAAATLVTVRTASDPFSFMLRDVNDQQPIFIRSYGVAVTTGADRRGFDEVARSIADRGLVSELDRIALEPEETFEDAAGATRSQVCDTWLGLSRDMRMFGVVVDKIYGFLGQFTQFMPRHPAHGLPKQPPRYGLVLGRGAGCQTTNKRRLEDGVLPILHTSAEDGEIHYRSTAFVSHESSPLTVQTLRGTDYLVADGHSAGHMFTPDQQSRFDALVEQETTGQPEQTVLYYRAEAINTGAAPRHAFIRSLMPIADAPGPSTFDGKTGLGVVEDGTVWSIVRLNGKPMPQTEVSVLLQPGAKAVLEFALPHSPLPADRAQKLAGFDFDARHAECRAFWQARLDAVASIRVPEERIDQMIRAGLLHLDLVAYGREPDEPVAATIGWYSPIGSESSPIIQFIDSMNWPSLAERALEFFLEKQHDDGLIQNFGGYMLETGPALWSLAEHYRYTRNDDWLRRIEPKVLKACKVLLDWRERNKTEELRGRGYGLIEGRVADPVDPFRQFMLNGYAHLGVKRAAELLTELNPAESRRLAEEAEAWRQDIRTAVGDAMGESPVVPLGDGTWVPTAPPWAELRGPAALYLTDEPCFSHSTFGCRDSMLGPLYLILCEVLDPDEPLADFIIRSHQVLFTVRNVAFSQPYYARHDFAHLRRGEVNAFLKTWYNTFASLADRQTYTFWEHYYEASPHKVHEESWFLMQTRWMLWMEQGDALRLLPAIPRAWMESGKRLELNSVASHFGPINLRVESKLDSGIIEADLGFQAERAPKQVVLRLPHPRGLKATSVDGGAYDPDREAVVIDPVSASHSVVVRY